MVLVISAAKASVIQIHTMDHLSSCSGAGKAWTVAAITPAAAGVGIPMKYFEPPGATDNKREAEPPPEMSDLLNERRMSKPRQVLDAPGVGKQGRRNSEADDIGERVELNAKIGICFQ